MKRFFILGLLTVLCSYAYATTTWTEPSTLHKSARATTTTGTEAAPSGNTAGMSLQGINGFTLYARVVTDGGTFTACTLDGYVYNVVSERWHPAPGFNVSVSASVTSVAFPGFLVTSQMSRIAFVPNGCGSLTFEIDLIGSK